jgi:alcohol dehydrogenase class IV|tara:strand:- start:5566 stop:5784 length:219 start_codon:yes stop_codon:yes gene_type:complete
MANKNSKPTRINMEFEKDMRKIAQIRFQKGLAKFNPKELGTSEMTKLLRRTKGYQISLEELKTKPKKENIRI